MGEDLEFRITVKNTGNDSTTDGIISEFYLSDYFDNRYLEFVSLSGTGWSEKTSNISNDTTTIQFKYKNELNLGNSTTLTLKFKVKFLNLATDITTINTAEITTSDTVNNKNSNNIRPELNGNLKSQVTLKILTYHITLNKYISKVNNETIEDRSQITNIERNNNPVEIEQND